VQPTCRAINRGIRRRTARAGAGAARREKKLPGRSFPPHPTGVGLAQTVGAKGYHDRVFAEGPYPVD
jgi:hypothetical protein